MADLNLEGSPKTPTIEFNSGSGYLLIRGRSIPENSIEFYSSLIAWTDTLCSSEGFVEVNINLEYFNTSSSKCLMDLLKRIESANVKAQINWHYEEDDEDMLEAGEDYDAIIDLPFKLIIIEG